MNIFIEIKKRQWERHFIRDARRVAKLLFKYCRKTNYLVACENCKIKEECWFFLKAVPDLSFAIYTAESSEGKND